MKLAPGHIDFDRLTNAAHRKAFLDARIKEVQSLIDNKAIKILSSEESRAFRRDHPDCVLPSRYVDRWKPSGDGKFSTLPEHFDDPGFEPLNNPGLAAKSRWCVVGWRDPWIHAIERSAPTPLSSSIMLFLQTRKWTGKIKDCKTAFLQSLPTTRKQRLCCSMPPGEGGVFPGCTKDQLVQLETEVYGLVSGPAWWRKSFLQVLVQECGYRINSYDRCVLSLDADPPALKPLPGTSTTPGTLPTPTPTSSLKVSSRSSSSSTPSMGEKKPVGTSTQGLIVIEIDDVLEAGNEEHRRRMAWLESRLRFGKAVNLQEEKTGTGYAGRRLRQLPDHSFELTMADYIKNRLKPVERSSASSWSRTRKASS